MNPVENTENAIRRAKIKIATDPEMDRRVLHDSFEAMNEGLANHKAAPPQRPLRLKALSLAAAAIIVVSIGLVAIQLGTPSHTRSEAGPTAKAPADRLSAMSINMAFRRGGMDAVDDLAYEAFASPTSQSNGLSVQKLLSESNGV